MPGAIIVGMLVHVDLSEHVLYILGYHSADW